MERTKREKDKGRKGHGDNEIITRIGYGNDRIGRIHENSMDKTVMELVISFNLDTCMRTLIAVKMRKCELLLDLDMNET